MDPNKTNIAETLFKNYQQLNLDTNVQTFGCPNCACQGSLFIEVHQNGITNGWTFDYTSDTIPVNIRAFAQEIYRTLKKLE